MTEMTDSAVAIPTHYQSMFALMFGDAIQQITSFSEKFFNHQNKEKTNSTNSADVSENCEEDIATTVAPPIVSVIPVKNADHRRIAISNVPPVKLSDLNYCILERVLNHVKDAYIKGHYEDDELKDKYAEREFKFCMPYFFQHDGDNNLTVDFYVSYTEDAPTWVNNPNVNAEDHLTPMSDDEVNLIANAFIRQCSHALRNYVNLIFNYSVERNIKPEYYSRQFPET